MSVAPIDELISRLRHTDPRVRRLAAMDLTRIAADPRARTALWDVYTNPATPARPAHAAVLAHDSAIHLEGHETGRKPNSEEPEVPGEEPEGPGFQSP